MVQIRKVSDNRFMRYTLKGQYFAFIAMKACHDHPINSPCRIYHIKGLPYETDHRNLDEAI